MHKRIIAFILLMLLVFVSGCGSSSQTEKKAAAGQNPAAMSDSAPSDADDKPRISIVAIRESSSSILDKSGEVLKSGGQYIADGSSKIAKSTGNFLVDAWNWTKETGASLWRGTKHAFAVAGDWLGERWDALTNADPMKKDLVAASLKKLETEVNAYNQMVTTAQDSMDQLYETKNKTSITLKAVDRYTASLGRLPIGYDNKISATQRDFDKYDRDLHVIQEKVKSSKWNTSADVANLGDAAAAASGSTEEAKSIDKASELMLKIASACGKDDAAGMIDTFKGAAKVAMSVGSLLAVTGADMGVSATLVVAGPIVLQIVDVAGNALSERSANKKMAAEAEKKCSEVAAARIKLEQFNQRVLELNFQIAEKEAKVANLMSLLLTANVDNYDKAAETQKKQINTLVDESNVLSKLLVTTVK